MTEANQGEEDPAYARYQGKVNEEVTLCKAKRNTATCRLVHFRPLDAFCTCNDWECNSICCHLLAARHLPLFSRQLQPLLTLPTADTAIGITDGVKYEEATREPLGPDIQQELEQMREAGEAYRQSMHAQRSNADSVVAEVRSLTSVMQRCALGAPAGDSRDECLRLMREAAERIQQLASEAGFQLTEVRAGKKWRRQANRRKEVPLHPWRTKKVALSRNGQDDLPELPKLSKKGKAPSKVRSPCLTMASWQCLSDPLCSSQPPS